MTRRAAEKPVFYVGTLAGGKTATRYLNKDRTTIGETLSRAGQWPEAEAKTLAAQFRMSLVTMRDVIMLG